MRFRQQADGGRRVGAGEQEQRAGFGDGAEAAGDAHPIGIDGAPRVDCNAAARPVETGDFRRDDRLTAELVGRQVVGHGARRRFPGSDARQGAGQAFGLFAETVDQRPRDGRLRAACLGLQNSQRSGPALGEIALADAMPNLGEDFVLGAHATRFRGVPAAKASMLSIN